ncbi:MAG: trigger factor [Acidimicrobiales bacterium]
MRATAEPFEGNKVKLSVTLDDEEMARAVEAALGKMAKEARIPGFRPGKVPRKLLQARVGPAAIRQAALNDVLPDYYSQALRQADVDAIAQPQIDVTSGEESGSLSFDATVEVRPKVGIPGYEGLAVTLPGLTVEDAEVEAQVDKMRAQSAALTVADRAAADGDHVTINVKTTRDGELVAAFSYDELSYEVGSASIVPEVDTQLQGRQVGDIVRFDAEVAGANATLEILVKEVKEKVLPEADDSWVAGASEFETMEELRTHLRSRLTSIKRERARLSVRDLALGALVELVVDDPPEPLVSGELQRRIQDFGQHLDRRRIDLQKYLSMSGLTQEQLVDDLRHTSTLAVKSDLALRALIDAESIQSTEEDLDAELAALAEHLKQDPARVRATLEESNQLDAVRGDVRKAKALDWLAEHVELRDPEGRSVDRADLQPPEEPEAAVEAPEAAVEAQDAAAEEPDAAASVLPSDRSADDEQPTPVEDPA